MKRYPTPIVLLTDFGLADPFVGVVKGVILSNSPNTPIIDLSHSIRPHDIHQAGRMLFDNYFFFPSGSIFLCVVDPGVGGNRNILCLHNGGYFFIAPDNGLLSKFFSNRESKSETRSVSQRFSKNPSHTFHGRDIMAHLAARLSKSSDFFNQVGPIVSTPKTIKAKVPQIKTHQIAGEVIDFDRFGNALTNIPGELIRPHSKMLTIKTKHIKLPFVQYYEESRRKPAALINSNNSVELFLYQKSIREALKLKRGDKVIIPI